MIEALDNGKSIRETRDADVQVVIRHLYHYAGWAELMAEGKFLNASFSNAVQDDSKVGFDIFNPIKNMSLLNWAS